MKKNFKVETIENSEIISKEIVKNIKENKNKRCKIFASFSLIIFNQKSLKYKLFYLTLKLTVLY